MKNRNLFAKKSPKRETAEKESMKYDACFPDYTGRKRFEVTHPAHKKPIKVAAPDWQSAIYTAAMSWGEEWGRLAFYAYCTVYEVY